MKRHGQVRRTAIEFAKECAHIVEFDLGKQIDYPSNKFDIVQKSLRQMINPMAGKVSTHQ